MVETQPQVFVLFGIGKSKIEDLRFQHIHRMHRNLREQEMRIQTMGLKSASQRDVYPNLGQTFSNLKLMGSEK
jgi:hypothetical protein